MPDVIAVDSDVVAFEAQSPMPGQRPRRRAVVVAIAVVVIAMAGAWYLDTTLTYPLDTGGYSKVDSGPGVISVSTFSGHRETQFPLRPGGLTRFTFSIRNTGTRGVRVTEVASDGPLIVQDVRVNGPAQNPSASTEPTTPMRPVTLNEGETLILAITIRLREYTYPPCSGLSFDSVPVRFSVLGVSREQRVPLGFVIDLVAPDPSGTACMAN